MVSQVVYETELMLAFFSPACALWLAPPGQAQRTPCNSSGTAPTRSTPAPPPRTAPVYVRTTNPISEEAPTRHHTQWWVACELTKSTPDASGPTTPAAECTDCPKPSSVPTPPGGASTENSDGSTEPDVAPPSATSTSANMSTGRLDAAPIIARPAARTSSPPTMIVCAEARVILYTQAICQDWSMNHKQMQIACGLAATVRSRRSRTQSTGRRSLGRSPGLSGSSLQPQSHAICQSS